MNGDNRRTDFLRCHYENLRATKASATFLKWTTRLIVKRAGLSGVLGVVMLGSTRNAQTASGDGSS
jgi:hypothetical protein